MLVLSRNEGQRLIIETSDGPIVLDVSQAQNGRARLAIDAPQAVQVWREELWAERMDGRQHRPPRPR